MITRRQIRKMSGLSLAAVAARAGKSIPTLRVFEADEDAVMPETKPAIAPVYKRLEADLHARLRRAS